MFGYINVNGAQLSEENKKIYQSYYCGLCRKLKEFCGKKGQALLNYDMTFLVVLLTGLYEPDTQTGEFTCMMHPMKKRQLRLPFFHVQSWAKPAASNKPLEAPLSPIFQPA